MTTDSKDGVLSPGRSAIGGSPPKIERCPLTANRRLPSFAAANRRLPSFAAAIAVRRGETYLRQKLDFFSNPIPIPMYKRKSIVIGENLRRKIIPLSPRRIAVCRPSPRRIAVRRSLPLGGSPFGGAPPFAPNRASSRKEV